MHLPQVAARPSPHWLVSPLEKLVFFFNLAKMYLDLASHLQLTGIVAY